jgi:hypothetical protein
MTREQAMATAKRSDIVMSRLKDLAASLRTKISQFNNRPEINQ